MNNYNKLQKYLENSGNATVILSFDTLKEILGIEVNYTAALCIKKDFHCSYVVDDVSEKNPDLHTGYKSSKIVTTLNFGVGSQWRADTNRADVHHGIKTRNYHQHRSF